MSPRQRPRLRRRPRMRSCSSEPDAMRRPRRRSSASTPHSSPTSTSRSSSSRRHWTIWSTAASTIWWSHSTRWTPTARSSSYSPTSASVCRRSDDLLSRLSLQEHRFAKRYLLTLRCDHREAYISNSRCCRSYRMAMTRLPDSPYRALRMT
uniref:Uncharacterized protein n=1 Tax=Setaria viridis TaxID=4556 RepID=A0A4U6UXH1_SETVI|nr:hypothetical protein SEVIR_4G160201v2 [Setaria viridis]